MINNILISRETRKMLSKENRFLGMEGENLQETLVFNLDEDLEGTALIEIQFPDETKGFVEVEKTEQGYELPVKSSLLTQKGIVKMQLRILQSGQEIFKSETIRFNVEKSINATETIPEQYPTWIDKLENIKSSLEKAESERQAIFTQMQKDTEEAIDNIKDMTEEYNENAQAKIDEYNANVQVIEPRIIELENENAMLKNQIPTGEAEGENITLNDSAEMQFKELRIGGNSWQESRSGKNKFDINAEKETFSQLLYKYSYYLKPNTKYTISSNCPTSSTANVYANSGSSNDKVHINKSQTVQSDKNGYFYILVRYYADGSDDTTFNIYEKILNGTYYIQIEEGSVATEYEQYGAMPSPEFRSEIKNVNGSANITVCNKNLFNLKNINNLGLGSKNNYYVVYENATYKGFLLELDKNQTNITISRKNITDFNRFNFGFTDVYPSADIKVYNSEWSNKIINATDLIKITLEIPSQAKYLVCYFSNTNETITEDTEIQIEYGEKTDYISCQSQQIIFPLSEGQRMYKDSYLADDGVHHKRKQVVLDGTETIGSYRSDTTNGYCGFSLTLPERHIANSNLLSNYFTRNPSGVYANSSTGIWTPDLGRTIYMCVPVSILTDVSTATAQVNSFRSWLSEQYANGTPVIVEYELAEEIIEPYTEEQQAIYNEIKKATSYKNITHIFSTDETSPIFEVKYRKDLETMFNKLTNTETVQTMIDNSVGSTIGGEY